MKKIIMLASMAVVILAQGFILGQFFVNRYDVILGGDTFKFLVSDVELENARERGYIDIKLSKNVTGEGNFATLKIDENGFAELADVVIERPTFGAYIENGAKGEYIFPFQKYYIDLLIPHSKKAVFTDESVTYITVRIKDGKAELLKLMIDDKEVEKYCK